MEKTLFFNVIVAIAASVTSLAGGQLPDVQGVARDNTVTIAMVGGMAQVTITKDEAGNTVISDYGVEALVCHLEEGKKGVVVYPLSEYTDELGQENEIRKQDSSFNKEYAVELCDKVWGNLWR